jgi:hypothetical protein
VQKSPARSVNERASLDSWPPDQPFWSSLDYCLVTLVWRLNGTMPSRTVKFNFKSVWLTPSDVRNRAGQSFTYATLKVYIIEIHIYKCSFAYSGDLQVSTTVLTTRRQVENAESIHN